jgi:hypothetical protein
MKNNDWQKGLFMLRVDALGKNETVAWWSEKQRWYSAVPLSGNVAQLQKSDLCS